MDWLILVTLSIMAFAIINILDRKFLGELHVHPLIFPAIATTLGTFFTFIICLVLIGVPNEIPEIVVWYGIIIGIFNFSSSALFYWAISEAPISKIIALDRIKIIIALSIAVLFFKENFYWIWIPGILFILLGNLLLIKKTGKKISSSFEKGVILMLLAGLIGGFQVLPEKMGADIGVPVVVALIASATRSCGYIFSALVFRRSHFEHFFLHLKKIRWTSMLIFRSFCSASGWVAFYYALDLTLVSKIIPLMQLRPVIAVILAAIFLNEKETKKRLFATILITIGILLIVI